MASNLYDSAYCSKKYYPNKAFVMGNIS